MSDSGSMGEEMAHRNDNLVVIEFFDRKVGEIGLKKLFFLLRVAWLTRISASRSKVPFWTNCPVKTDVIDLLMLAMRITESAEKR